MFLFFSFNIDYVRWVKEHIVVVFDRILNDDYVISLEFFSLTVGSHYPGSFIFSYDFLFLLKFHRTLSSTMFKLTLKLSHYTKPAQTLLHIIRTHTEKKTKKKQCSESEKCLKKCSRASNILCALCVSVCSSMRLPSGQSLKVKSRRKKKHGTNARKESCIFIAQVTRIFEPFCNFMVAIIIQLGNNKIIQFRCSLYISIGERKKKQSKARDLRKKMNQVFFLRK